MIPFVLQNTYHCDKQNLYAPSNQVGFAAQICTQLSHIMSDDEEEYEYDYGSDGYLSDSKEEMDGGDSDELIEIENSYYGNDIFYFFLVNEMK